jgi:hypothetical protein
VHQLGHENLELNFYQSAKTALSTLFIKPSLLRR